MYNIPSVLTFYNPRQNVAYFEQDPSFIKNPIDYLNRQPPNFLGYTPVWHAFVQDILHQRIAKNTQELQQILQEDRQTTQEEIAQTLPPEYKALKYKVWTAEEQKHLFDLTLEGKSIAEICHILERTSKSVERRLQRLKLMPFHANNRTLPDRDFEEIKSLQMGINDLKSVALRIKRTKPECLKFLKRQSQHSSQ